MVADPPLVIVREALLVVRFALLVRPGTRFADVRTIASHPHGVAQTRGWIARPAARRRRAAVGTRRPRPPRRWPAASSTRPSPRRWPREQHGLEILADDIADNAGAVTRFALVSPPGPPPAPTGRDRTSLAATTQNRPGALLGLLTELAVRGSTSPASSPGRSRTGTPSTGSTSTAPATSPSRPWGRRSPRCTAGATACVLGSYPRAGNGRSPRPGVPSAPTVPAAAAPVGAADAAEFAAAQEWLERAARRDGGMASASSWPGTARPRRT